MVLSQTETMYSRETKISVSVPELGVTIPPLFCVCLWETNTHLKHLDDATDAIYCGRKFITLYYN